MLDDDTKNLNEWESFGGKGIKRLTVVSDNNQKKKESLTLKDLQELTNIIAI